MNTELFWIDSSQKLYIPDFNNVQWTCIYMSTDLIFKDHTYTCLKKLQTKIITICKTNCVPKNSFALPFMNCFGSSFFLSFHYRYLYSHSTSNENCVFDRLLWYYLELPLIYFLVSGGKIIYSVSYNFAPLWPWFKIPIDIKKNIW